MIRSLALVAALMLTPVSLAQDAPLTPEPRPAQIGEGPLEPLNHFLGDWEIEATWAWGATLRARNEYRVGLNARFVEVTTIVSDNNGPAYERYLSFYTAHNNDFKAVGFTFDGSVSELPYTLEREGETIVITTDTTTNGARLRQRFETQGDDAYTWKAWMTAPGADTEQLIMDGVWKRVRSDDAPADQPEANAATPARPDLAPVNPTIFVTPPQTRITLAPGGMDHPERTQTDARSAWASVLWAVCANPAG